MFSFSMEGTVFTLITFCSIVAIGLRLSKIGLIPDCVEDFLLHCIKFSVGSKLDGRIMFGGQCFSLVFELCLRSVILKSSSISGSSYFLIRPPAS